MEKFIDLYWSTGDNNNKQNSTEWADMGHLIQSSSSIQFDLPISPVFTCQPKFCSSKMSDKKPSRVQK